MSKPTFVLATLMFVALLGFSQEKQEKKETPQAPPPTAELKVPPEEAAKPNPVKPSENSIAEGKKVFATQCTMCHGESGDGKGDLVEPMNLKLKDWQDPASLKEFSDGALFYVLTKGHKEMPSQEGRMKDNQKWDLINYIRSLSKKEPPKEPAKEQKP